MEERPKFSQEQPEDDSHESTIDDRRSRVSRWKGSEGYWARLLGEPPKEVEKPKEKSKEKDEDDKEEDDDDDSTPTNVEKSTGKETSGWIGRYDRFKKLFSRNMLVVEDKSELVEGTESTSLPVVEVPEPVASTEREENWPPTAPDTEVASTPELPTEIEADAPLERIEDIKPEPVEPFFDATTLRPYVERGQTEDAHEVVQSDQPVPEPESIEAILRRRQNEEVYRSSEPMAEASRSEVIVSEPKAEVYNDKHVNTGLHLLNYGLALRRDKRNQAINKHEFKRVDKDIEELKQKSIDSENTMLKQQQKIEYSEPVKSSESVPEAIAQRVNIDRIVEKTTNINEQSTKHSELIERRLREITEKTKPETALESHEAFMQKVAEAVESQSSIKSEMAYERRHEVKDNQGIPVGAQNLGIESSELNNYDSVQNIYTPEIINDKLTKIPQMTDQKAYKQAVASGAMGAAVGIIIFVAFYILTSR